MWNYGFLYMGHTTLKNRQRVAPRTPHDWIASYAEDVLVNLPNLIVIQSNEGIAFFWKET